MRKLLRDFYCWLFGEQWSYVNFTNEDISILYGCWVFRKPDFTITAKCNEFLVKLFNSRPETWEVGFETAIYNKDIAEIRGLVCDTRDRLYGLIPEVDEGELAELQERCNGYAKLIEKLS